jgi:hypothetical protein
MCLICVEYEKQKLTVKEALRNLLEMKPQIDDDHYWATYSRLNDDLDEELLEEWWEQFGFGD